MFQNIIQIVKKNLFFGCIDGCKNNPENSSTAKVSEHIPSGFSMSITPSWRTMEYKHDLYRGKDCMEMFCKSSREHQQR